jgi:hypothetical protein
MSDKTGGTAFPATNHYGHKLEGMTLRDYFAAKAMQGLIAGADDEIREYLDNLDDPMTNLATAAFLMADAMLKARE